MVILLVAFSSGIFTILAPSIWPLLPLILSTSNSHATKWRPLGITIGVVTSFAIFALLISSLVTIFHIPTQWLRYTSALVLVGFGIMLISTKLNERVMEIVHWGTHFWIRPGETWDDGFWGGLLTGLTLGLVWAPCIGPILTTLGAVSKDVLWDPEVLLVTGAYILGIGIPLLIIAYGWQGLFGKSGPLKKYERQIQIGFGIWTLVIALMVATSLDVKAQKTFLQLFPGYSHSLDKLDQTENFN